MVEKKRSFRIPGPTPLPLEIRRELGEQVFNHRSPEFAELLGDTTQRLKEVFQTSHDVLMFTASGTGGLEAAVANIFSPGDRVVAVSVGEFGDRFADIAQRHHLKVNRVSFMPGRGVDPELFSDSLDLNKTAKGVLLTHNETSTGVTNDLETLSGMVKERGMLLVVDAISSLGAINLPTDEWGCDVVVTASHKAFGVPPGLTMISVSEAAWDTYHRSSAPRFYFDFGKAKECLEKGQTPFTPAIVELRALHTALTLIEKEGLEQVFERHRLAGEHIREGVTALGLELFADSRYASNTVTAVRSRHAKQIIAGMLERGVEVAGGEGYLNGHIFRIGHLGFFTKEDLYTTLTALKAVL